MPQISQLEALRDTVAGYLSGLGPFQGITVSTRKDGDIVNTIQTAIGKVGVSAEFFIKSARPTQSQSWSVVYDPVVLGLVVYENVLLNQDPQTGTGKGAYFLIEEAVVALKLWTPPGFSNVIMPADAGVQHGQSDKTPTLLILQHEFSTTLQLAKRPS